MSQDLLTLEFETIPNLIAEHAKERPDARALSDGRSIPIRPSTSSIRRAPPARPRASSSRTRCAGARSGAASIGYGPDAVTMISTPLYSNTTLVSFFPTLAQRRHGGADAQVRRGESS
jgi:hypothetical protein